MSPEQMKRILNQNDGAVGRAMVMLLAEQTVDERRNQDVNAPNGRGFSVRTKDNGTYCARWVLDVPRNVTDTQLATAIFRFVSRRGFYGRPLTGKWVEIAREIAIFHHRQLSELVNAQAPF